MHDSDECKGAWPRATEGGMENERSPRENDLDGSIRTAQRVCDPHGPDDASKHEISCKKNERARENTLANGQKDETERDGSPG